jgi:hypothetical protein
LIADFNTPESILDVRGVPPRRYPRWPVFCSVVDSRAQVHVTECSAAKSVTDKFEAKDKGSLSMIDLPRGRSRRRRRTPKPDNSPTPEQIREMTERIRESWSPRELRRRSNTMSHMQVMQMPLEPRRKGFWGD